MLHFDLTAKVWVLSNWVEDTSLQQFLLSSLYSFDSIFIFWLYYSGIAWIDKLHICIQRICFIIYQGNRKKTPSHFSWERLQRGYFVNNVNLTDLNYHWKKLSRTDEVLSEKKSCKLKKLFFEKKRPKVKRNFHLKFLITFHKTFTFMSIFYNFALKKTPVK